MTFILTLVGLLFTLWGALTTARGVMLTPEQAGEIGVTRIAPNDPSEWPETKMAKNLLAASRAARNGLLLIAFGTFLQIMGVMASTF